MIKRKNSSRTEKIRSDAIVKFGADSKIIQSEFYQGKPRKYNKRVLNVMNKMASISKSAAAGCHVGSTAMSNPMFYHPEYEPSSLLMPRDPIEINAWARYFYKYDALVSTAIDCHAELPISTIRLTMPGGRDRKKNVHIKEQYEEMCSSEYLDLFNKLLQVGVEYYKLGNVFPFAQWSEKQNKWVKLTLLDPDYVEIDKLQFSDRMRVDLRPNDRLKEIVANGPSHPKTGLLYQAVPEDVRELISTGKKIPLNTNPNNGSHVSHIAYKMADYDAIGTGLIERNFKPLVYKDRLRQSQDAIAARHLTPKHLVWAENMGNMDTEAVREQIDNAFADPDYAIVTNFELHWELIGTSQGLMQLESEWSWINEELMIGLMINRSFLLGEGTFANGQTVLEVMNQRYSIYRERLENYITHYLFKPMAMKNEWCEYEAGTLKKEKKIKWLYPKIKWNRLNFVDDTAHKQMMSQMVTQGQIDLETWLECFGLDAETIKERLAKYEGTPLDINYFAENQAIASEVGRSLAPAIAKLRAEQRGVELPKEEEVGKGGMVFSNKEKGIVKIGNTQLKILDEDDPEFEKEAETREERESQRAIRREQRRTEDTVKDLEVPLEKAKKPPREDMKKPKLFEASDAMANAFINNDKAEKIVEAVQNDEVNKDAWLEEMQKLGFDSNARRAAIALEEEMSGLNGNNTPETRIKILRKQLPQIYASKIKGFKTLMEKVEAAKERYADNILDDSYEIDLVLGKAKDPFEIKSSIRTALKEAFEKQGT